FIGTALAIGSIDNRFVRQLERHPVAGTGQRGRATESYATNAGDTLHGFRKLYQVEVQCGRIGILLIGCRKTECQYARGIHPGVYVDQSKEAADQQPGTSQKDEGYSDFSHHQSVTHDLASAARCRSTA